MKTGKIILGIIGALFILVLSQTIAEVAASLLILIHVPAFVCNAFAGIMYLALAFFILKLFAEKILKCSLEDLAIPKIKISLKWIITAIALPAAVTGIFLLLSGEMKRQDISASSAAENICLGIFYYGLAAGVVEELVFRGFIMNLLGSRFGKVPAMIIPSVLFGFVHILGTEFSVLSCIQVIIAGSAVGIMFSLIAFDENSVWNSAVVHAVWNISILGGFISVGDKVNENALYSYVLNTDNFAVTGGEFGIESSVIAIIAYIAVCGIACIFAKNKKESE